jgi:hypothetical protein
MIALAHPTYTHVPATHRPRFAPTRAPRPAAVHRARQRPSAARDPPHACATPPDHEGRMSDAEGIIGHEKIRVCEKNIVHTLFRHGKSVADSRHESFCCASVKNQSRLAYFIFHCCNWCYYWAPYDPRASVSFALRARSFNSLISRCKASHCAAAAATGRTTAVRGENNEGRRKIISGRDTMFHMHFLETRKKIIA